MPSSRRSVTARPHRGPLVYDTRTLPRRPGSVRAETRIAPAPADLRTPMAGVLEGAGLELQVRLEAVSEGVLATAVATVPVTGECARCLAPLTQTIEVSCQELFTYAPAAGDGDDDGYALAGDLLDLEPALRDAVVLALPLAPLCRDDCPGLCPDCGARLADVGRGHRHDDGGDPRWSGLADRVQASGPDGPAGTGRT